MTFPVRVVIPTIPSRVEFLTSECLPSVIANSPAEIEVICGLGGAPEKRNRGSKGTTQPYLLFVDDDVRLLKDCLREMVFAAELHQTAFVYSNFWRICRFENKECRTNDKNCVVYPGPFNAKRLRADNYIDTTSLIRTSEFPGFDVSIRRFQDWDLWLSIVSAGGIGTYIDKTLFESWHIDWKISDVVPEEAARRVIAEKHHLVSLL